MLGEVVQERLLRYVTSLAGGWEGAGVLLPTSPDRLSEAPLPLRRRGRNTQ